MIACDTESRLPRHKQGLFIHIKILLLKKKRFAAAGHVRDRQRRLRPLDAEDLMVGHKVDVGVRLRSGWAWRTLMNRTVSFALPEPLASAATLHPGVVDDLIAKLIPNREERMLLESGTVRDPGHLRRWGRRSVSPCNVALRLWLG